MFTGFFYLLRAHGFRVSLNEWMTLIEGLMLDLQHDSLTGFYELCRAVLVKSEADYDKFDQIFLEYFDGVPYQDELPEELMDWLNNPAAAMEEFRKFLRTQGYEEKSIEEILKMFEERLKEQTEEHNGGSYWIGTNGYSNFGNSGHSPQGIRVGDIVHRHKRRGRAPDLRCGRHNLAVRCGHDNDLHHLPRRRDPPGRRHADGDQRYLLIPILLTPFPYIFPSLFANGRPHGAGCLYFGVKKPGREAGPFLFT